MPTMQKWAFAMRPNCLDPMQRLSWSMNNYERIHLARSAQILLYTLKWAFFCITYITRTPAFLLYIRISFMFFNFWNPINVLHSYHIQQSFL
jgi:hypothetical protein